MHNIDLKAFGASKANDRKALAILAYESGKADPSVADWQTISDMLRTCIPAVRKAKESDVPDWWICSEFGRKYERTTISVQFDDGRIVRANVCTAVGKPYNIGRGVRTAIAFYRQRIFRSAGYPTMTVRTHGDDGRELPGWTAHITVPRIERVTRIEDGFEFDAAEITRLTAEWRAGPWDFHATLMEAVELGLPFEHAPGADPFDYRQTHVWEYVSRSCKAAWLKFSGLYVSDEERAVLAHEAEQAAFDAALEAELAEEPEEEPEPVRPRFKPSSAFLSGVSTRVFAL